MIYLREQRKLHPSMEAQDALKLCYQAAFGAEHLLSDVDGARKYFENEFEAVCATQEPLYENISDKVCRVNLGAWKREGLCADWLWKIFLLSGEISADSSKAFAEYVVEAAEEIEGFQGFFGEYLKGGIRAVHHSDRYRCAEQPHYRVVKSEIARIIPVLQKISFANAKVVSIDGKAASGKTTVSKVLESVINSQTVHMDHFFLPPQLRLPHRLGEIGGNVHYERFQNEVLPYLKSGKKFSYRIFDCSIMDYGETNVIGECPYIVVEGAYSAHPFFSDYAEVKVFSDVDEREQMRRILVRNGEKMAKRFSDEWIPMEEAYFAHFRIKENADIII